MDIDSFSPSTYAMTAYRILKWTLFVIELILLGVLLLVTFLVPIPPFRFGKLPQEAILVVLSAAIAISSGVLMTKTSKHQKLSFGNLIGTPPCVIEMTVVALVIIPMVVGLLNGL